MSTPQYTAKQVEKFKKYFSIMQTLLNMMDKRGYVPAFPVDERNAPQMLLPNGGVKKLYTLQELVGTTVEHFVTYYIPICSYFLGEIMRAVNLKDEYKKNIVGNTVDYHQFLSNLFIKKPLPGQNYNFNDSYLVYFTKEIMSVKTKNTKTTKDYTLPFQVLLNALFTNPSFGTHAGMLVTPEKPNYPVIGNIEELKSFDIQIYESENLKFDITTHQFSSPHVKLVKEEADFIINTLKQKGITLPTMKTIDATSRYYGLKAGDVVMIHRKQPIDMAFVQTSIAFRLVIEAKK